MRDRWDDGEASGFEGPLGQCVYGSRLIGSDPSLVLYGGGNTSVKAPWEDVTGDAVETLYVKGSGWDLATIEASGFAPLPLSRLRRLLELDELSDAAMMSALSAGRLDPSAPEPSVESLLHAAIPHPAVQHSHADAIAALTNLADGAERVAEVFGDDVLIVAYVMPGFELARAVHATQPERWPDRVVGMVLLHHGLFTFGDSTREAYARHVELIDRAEAWLDKHAPPPIDDGPPLPATDPDQLAELRRRVSEAAGAPMILTRHTGPAARRFVARPDMESLATRGPLTPDHVIRTKPQPMVGTDVEGFAERYEEYVARNQRRRGAELTPLDPAPRVVLDRELGMVTVGRTAADAAVAADIYLHTIPVLERAEDHLGGYRALDEADLFDVEYWELEQAKLRRRGPYPPMAGQVALVTGAASGIGRACAAELLGRGAAVVGLDLAATVDRAFEGPSWLGVTCDVTDADRLSSSIGDGVSRFGGLDMVVAAAGVFGDARPIADLDVKAWRRVMAVNVDAVAELMRMVHSVLARSPASPAVVMIGSKNVPAPGKGAAAYSVSKAALTQLARVAALEWAEDGIRVNCVHPDAVFDTGLWTPDLLAERAAHYGMTVEEYRRRNLLRTEITSADVARVVAELCSDTFRVTTGAQIPVDGGSDRVI
jgi:rhamnose utilization protein RhaD (predicted bifunctional aldolase and dehydrogenase)/NAD(P)-dependent dehydrogenase (short-subunit alcohol dehydrogenase family)